MTMNNNMRHKRIRGGVFMTAALMCAMLILPTGAGAGAGLLEGSVIATGEACVYVQSDAIVADISVVPGQEVNAGDALLSLRTEKVFAQEDGTVADIESESGEYINGIEMKIAPTSPYEIICTVSDAYEAPENMLIHMGQTLYVKCTKDGTHRAIARVKAIDGEQYTLETLGGELYIGETVYLYESDEFAKKEKLGIGTVISSAPCEYETSGRITEMYVSAGDEVERGQLLYEYLPGSAADTDTQARLNSSVSGIITNISASEGSALKSGDAVFTIAPRDKLRLSVTVEEDDAAKISIGERVEILLPWQENEDTFGGTVVWVSPIDANSASSMTSTAGAASASSMTGMTGAASASSMTGTAGAASATATTDAQQSDSDSQPQYEVLIQPDDMSLLRIGMSVRVAFGGEAEYSPA